MMSFVRAFFIGLGKLVEIWPTIPTPKPRSDLDALRGDMMRIGDDMRHVIAGEKNRLNR